MRISSKTIKTNQHEGTNMWPFSKNKEVRRIALYTEQTGRNLQQCVRELRALDRTLRKLEKELPTNTKSEMINALQTKMLITDRQSEQMLEHIRSIKIHVQAIEARAKEVQVRHVHVK